MSTPTSVTIVIPVYNERKTLSEILERVLAAETCGLKRDLIIVDDGSTDGTRDWLSKYSHPDTRVIMQEKNAGKGAALRAGFAAARGELVLIQDADLEYDPSDYVLLIEPFLTHGADVVFGSRFRGSKYRRVLHYRHALGNRIISHICNLFTNHYFTDVMTCYKIFRRDLLDRFPLHENGFAFEAEFAVKIAQCRVRLYEVGIRYDARTYDEGKKIRLIDGWRVIRAIVRYSLLKHEVEPGS